MVFPCEWEMGFMAYLFTWLECSPLDLHSFDPRGVILDAPKSGLPCFPFPRAWKIASLRDFSLWLAIAGNALFLRVC